MAEFTLSSGAILNYFVPGSIQTNGMLKNNGNSQTFAKSKQSTVRKDDDDIEVVNSVVSCLDIISRKRIEKCVKSIMCDHIECFDLHSFCEINGIADSYFEREKIRFSSQYEAIPTVQNVTSEGRQKRRKKDTFVVRMSRKENSETLFKICRRKILTVAARKMTGKRKTNGWIVRCPLCGVKFSPNELLHDDFMTTIMRFVPKDVNSIEISEDWVVKIVREKSPFKNQEIVAIDDDIDDDVTKTTPKKKKSKRVLIDETEDEDYDDFHALFESPSEADDSEFAGTKYDPVVID